MWEAFVSQKNTFLHVEFLPDDGPEQHCVARGRSASLPCIFFGEKGEEEGRFLMQNQLLSPGQPVPMTLLAVAEQDSPLMPEHWLDSPARVPAYGKECRDVWCSEASTADVFCSEEAEEATSSWEMGDFRTQKARQNTWWSEASGITNYEEEEEEVTGSQARAGRPDRVASGSSARRSQARPCKGKRQRLRRLLHRLVEQRIRSPETFDMDTMHLPPSVSSCDQARAKLKSQVERAFSNLQRGLVEWAA